MRILKLLRFNQLKPVKSSVGALSSFIWIWELPQVRLITALAIYMLVLLLRQLPVKTASSNLIAPCYLVLSRCQLFRKTFRNIFLKTCPLHLFDWNFNSSLFLSGVLLLKMNFQFLYFRFYSSELYWTFGRHYSSHIIPRRAFYANSETAYNSIDCI